LRRVLPVGVAGAERRTTATLQPRADFIDGSFDAAGTFWAALVKQLGAPSEANTIATIGYVGHLLRWPRAHTGEPR
jgi:hypothetical protein